MKHKKLLLGCLSALTLLTVGTYANTTTAYADETVVSGKYISDSKEAIIKRINEIRKEAYEEGLVDRYVPIKWSTALEKIAEIRSVEASVLLAHSRPNGERDPFSIVKDNVRSYGENLAWNSTGVLEGIEYFYGEKAAYVKSTVNHQPLEVGEQTGHYWNLIRPDFTHTALVAFQKDGKGVITAQAFTNTEWLKGNGFDTNLSEDYLGHNGEASVNITTGGKTAKASSKQTKTVKQTNTTVENKAVATSTSQQKETTTVLNGWSDRSYYKNGEKVISQWIYDKNYSSWFYIDANGEYLENVWKGDYYLEAGGYMASGEWIYDTNYHNWFYLHGNGKYARQYWKDSYYLGQNGELARDTWVGTYYVDSTGKWNPEM